MPIEDYLCELSAPSRDLPHQEVKIKSVVSGKKKIFKHRCTHALPCYKLSLLLAYELKKEDLNV